MTIKYIRLISDLHLEYYKFEKETMISFLETAVPPLPTDWETILVLGGDIVGYRWDRIPDIMKWAQDRLCSCVFIPGNHEYWTGIPYSQNMKIWEEDIAGTKNMEDRTFSICGQTWNEEVELAPDTILLATTLWTDCGKDRPIDELYIKGFPDFRYIYLDPRSVATTHSIRAYHTVQKQRLEARLKALKELGKEVIVATHHLPSYQLCDPKYGPQEDSLFASNLDYILGSDWAPKYWLFGHTHVKIERKLGNTLCISNPFGYPNEQGPSPDLTKLIDIQ